MSSSVSLKLQDLTAAARSGKLSDIVERDAQLARLSRILLRPTHHHAIIVAEPGSGKTSLTEALALRLTRGHYRPLTPLVYRLATAPIKDLLLAGDSLRPCLDALTQAVAGLKDATIIIEDLQLLAADDAARLELTISVLQALASNPKLRLIGTIAAQPYHRSWRDDYVINRLFEAIELSSPTHPQLVSMVELALPRLERMNHQRIERDALLQAIEYGGRFTHGRANPDAAIRLLEDVVIKTGLGGIEVVSKADVTAVVAEREHLPLGTDLTAQTRDHLTGLEPALTRAVVGQSAAIKKIASQLARAQLGLTDGTRPRGSFLLLGPSGVGKTETAKALVREVYHNPASLIRLDMSEYSEEHAAVRLIGSPPGYVGYEEGGQLTGAVRREPYSLVLLDEIEKAHPKLFDLFLQLLDDGRLTDSAGHTVDFTETLVLATSNTGSHLIAQAAAAGTDVSGPKFLTEQLLPLLLHTYRPEFINRFDAILVYRPLSLTHLVALAQRELAQLSSRIKSPRITFAVPDARLANLLAPHANPLFGARPVRRVIADYFEAPLAHELLRGTLTGPLTITGSETWLNRTEVRA